MHTSFSGEVTQNLILDCIYDFLVKSIRNSFKLILQAPENNNAEI